MWGRLGPRFALEAAFLILLAVGLGLADEDWVVIVAVMAGGWALVSLIELIASRRPPWTVPSPIESRPPTPAPEPAAPEPAEAVAPLPGGEPEPAPAPAFRRIGEETEEVVVRASPEEPRAEEIVVRPSPEEPVVEEVVVRPSSEPREEEVVVRPSPEPEEVVARASPEPRAEELEDVREPALEARSEEPRRRRWWSLLRRPRDELEAEPEAVEPPIEVPKHVRKLAPGEVSEHAPANPSPEEER
jgi:hypothetical protein